MKYNFIAIMQLNNIIPILQNTNHYYFFYKKEKIWAFHPPFYLLSHWHTPVSTPTFFLQKESNKEKLFSFQILPLFEARCSYGAICDYLQYFRRWLTLRRLRRLAPQRTRFARLRRGGSLRGVRCLAISCLRSLRIRS